MLAGRTSVTKQRTNVRSACTSSGCRPDVELHHDDRQRGQRSFKPATRVRVPDLIIQKS
jgi:hypothetical protein